MRRGNRKRWFVAALMTLAILEAVPAFEWWPMTGLEGRQILDARGEDDLFPPMVLTDQGIFWWNGEVWAPFDLPAGEYRTYAPGDQPGQLLVGGENGVYQTTDNGSTWNPAQTGLPNDGFGPSSLTGGSGNDFFAVYPGSGAVFTSTDGASNWGPAGPLPPSYPYSSGFFNGNIFVGTSGTGLLYSTNGGNDWLQSGLGESQSTFVNALAGNDSIIIANNGDRNDQLYVSTDGATTFTNIMPPGMPGPVNSIALVGPWPAPNGKAAGGSIFIGTQSGKVFSSTDLGDTWTDLSAGLPGNAVTAVAYANGYLYAGTALGGMWRQSIAVCSVTCTADASPVSGDAPLTVNFTNTYDATGCAGTQTYAWTFGDGGTSTDQAPQHVYSAAGTYNWAFTVTVDDQTCSQSGTITVSEPPVCSVACTATADPSSGQAPLPVQFGSTVTSSQACAPGMTRAWTFDDGGTSTEQDPVHTYLAAGTYNWTFTATVDGQTCSQSGTVVVTAPPSCTVTCTATADPASGQAPLPVQFGATATAANCTGTPAYAWVFGDGETSSEQNQSHTYAAAGTFTWSLAVAVDGKTCTQMGIVIVTPGLPGDCNGDGTVSIGEVQKAINMFLGVEPPDCGVDCNGDGVVSIGEVQKVINAFLGVATSC